MNNSPKMLLFGAGKIGRSFIGQLFACGGYEVVFVDINQQVVDALNERKSYKVIIKSTVESVIKVENVRAIIASDSMAVTNEIATADIVAVSIGQNGLPQAIKLLAEGLLLRQKTHNYSALDIIIAENMANAANYFKTELEKILPHNYPIDDNVGLIETSIGKMVPIMRQKDYEADILQVFAEEYNTLILDKMAFKNSIPNIKGLEPKENMKAWVDRKLFIHNLGHATTAYLGYRHNQKFIYLYEVLDVPQINEAVKLTMQEAANLLVKKYPNEFTTTDLYSHIDDLIRRFQNRALGDTIYRVGCDLKRKLGPNDRLVGAIKLGIQLNMPYNKILEAYIAGCGFKATDEQGNRTKDDIDFSLKYETKGINWVLTEIGKLNY